MKHFFVYCYEWPDGMVYIGRSHINVNRFNNPECYKNNKKLYEAMTTRKYQAYIVFDSDNIWAIGRVEAALIHCTWPKSYNIANEKNWEGHIRGYIKQYGEKFRKMGWTIDG